MRHSVIIVFLFTAFFVGVVQAQETSYELLWSYGIGEDPRGISISSDGSYVAVGSTDNKVYFFDKEGELLWSYETGISKWDRVKDVSVSSDGSYVAVEIWGGGKFHFLNRKGELLRSDEVEGQEVSLPSDGSYVTTESRYKRHNKHMYLFEVVHFFSKEGELLWSFEIGIRSLHRVLGVSVSSDGSYVAAGSTDNKVYFFSREGELLWNYKTAGDIPDISVSSDGSYVAAGSTDNKVYFFNKNGNLLWSYKTAGDVPAISVSSDGSYVAAGSADNKVYFFVNVEKASITISETRGEIESLKTEGINVVEAESILLIAEQAFDTKDYITAITLSEQANANVDAKGKRAIPAKTAIDGANSTISQDREKGFNVANAEEILAQAEQAFKDEDYVKAKSLAEDASEIAETLGKEATEAQDVMEIAKESIRLAKEKGFNVVNAEEILAQAEQAFKIGDYSEAESLAEEAKANVEATSRGAESATIIIDEASLAVAGSSSIGGISYKISKADELLSQAEEAFDEGDYKRAYQLADEAKQRAESKVYVGIIYGAIAAIIGFVILFTGTVIRRKHHEKEAYEREKAEIVAMIGDVVKEK